MSFSFEKECYTVTFHEGEDQVYYVRANSEDTALQKAYKYVLEVFIGRYIFYGVPLQREDVAIYLAKLKELPYTVKYSGPYNMFD
ncbi:hypothetical protein ma809 [Moumouvirus australiensis]|uniref:Uncharacterized protein n=1 Tax=Moumouvirus australiensis TaxID=2109587 RepID=A0A2P1EMQ8_9VIRU|nr:hypothetical protein QKC55_gp095 [Moumouvirus australiensis]AVL95196.1 hypothetical protein ma809 [Moumouvirus australiensis]